MAVYGYVGLCRHIYIYIYIYGILCHILPNGEPLFYDAYTTYLPIRNIVSGVRSQEPGARSQSSDENMTLRHSLR